MIIYDHYAQFYSLFIHNIEQEVANHHLLLYCLLYCSHFTLLQSLYSTWMSFSYFTLTVTITVLLAGLYSAVPSAVTLTLISYIPFPAFFFTVIWPVLLFSLRQYFDLALTPTTLSPELFLSRSAPPSVLSPSNSWPWQFPLQSWRSLGYCH